MSREFYEWMFRNDPNRWDNGTDGHQGVDSFIVNFLKPYWGKSIKILDMGCGNGRTLNYIYRPEWQVTGIDFISEAIKAAKIKLGEKATLIVADMTNTRLESFAYDIVYSCGSHEHMDFPNFSEARRLMKHDGYFLCTVSIGDRGKVESAFCHKTGTPQWGRQWEWEFPASQWKSLLQEAGFDVINVNEDRGEFTCQGQGRKIQ
jgi:SAM-dependent methyltransferase